MISLPTMRRGRLVVFLVATSLCFLGGEIWAADKAGGEKKAVLDGLARTCDRDRDPVLISLESLEKRRLDLDERAKQLDLRETDLRRLDGKLASRIVALEKLRKDLRADLAKESAADDANIAHLAKIFSGMKVKAAANGLKSMDLESAVQVLKVMREKVAAKILSKMGSEDAVKLANELSLPLSERSRH